MPEKNTLLPKSYIYAIFLAIILILLDLVGFFSSYKSFRSYVSYPIIYTSSTISEKTRNLFTSLISGSSLKLENIELKQRILALESTIDIYQEEIPNYDEYVSVINKMNKLDYKKTTQARILSTHYNNSDGLLLIDVGSNDNIVQGAPVVFGKYYICFIEEIFPQYSTCKSIQMPNQEFVAYITNRKVTGILNTTVKDIFVTDLLATDNIVLGDSVKINIDKFDYFLTVGSIVEIPQKEGSAEKLAIINTSVDISELTFVTVILE